MLSIIIPTYNNEKYIRECLDSILNQTFTDYEIIIVDDCSTDNTLNIINEYLKKDNRIKLINNSVNVGVGLSRKIGYENSIGEFIYNIDSDDFLVGEKLLENVMNEFSIDIEIDMVSFPYLSENKKFIYRNNNLNKLILSSEKEKESLLRFDNFATIWNKIIKRELYEKYNLFSGLTLNEPPYTYFKLIYYCKKIISLPFSEKEYYFYRNNPKSITKNVNKINKLFHIITPMIMIYHFLTNEVNTNMFKHLFNEKTIKDTMKKYI